MLTRNENEFMKKRRNKTKDENLVLLDPDIHKAFPSPTEANEALRLVLELREVGRGKARV